MFGFFRGAWPDNTDVIIGVLAFRGEDTAFERWIPTADYLSKQIPSYHFVIKPLTLNGMRQAVRHHQVDFILTNPGNYIELQAYYGVTRLVTLKNLWAGKAYTVYGGVLFTRSDRSDIARISDLKNKSLLAVSKDAFGGFELVWRELIEKGINPFRDLSKLEFSGFPQDQIVYAVRNGEVDAGIVRTEILERMASESKIKLDEFRVLNPRMSKNFPFLHSTRLYPEWPLAIASQTSPNLAQKVAIALLTMPAENPAAKSGHYVGWTVPLDYQPIHDLFKELNLGPYRKDLSWQGLLRTYWVWFLLGISLIAVLTLSTVYVLDLNRRQRQSKRSLENEISKRELAREALRQSEGALRALHEITSAQDLRFEGKVQALLEMGCKRFGLPIGILSKVEGEKYEIVEVVAPDNSITKGSIFPLGHTYCCNTLQSYEPVSFEHASESEWRTHPAYRHHKLEAYIGIRVIVQGKSYGTLNFASPEKRQVLFTNTDKEILKLMAQWVGGEIQRKRAETEMQKLSSALEHTADSVMISDRSGVVVYVNRAFEQITGYSQDEVVGHIANFINYNCYDDQLYEQLQDTIFRGEVFRGAIINQRKDGAVYYEEKTITPLKDEQGNIIYFVSTGKDITERKLAEERARQHESQIAHYSRVSTMGEMASALAHELNQPLAAIVNYAQGCVRRLRSDAVNPQELTPALEQIVAQGERSGEIIRRLRNFMSKREPKRSHVDINDVIKEAADLASLEARHKNITLRFELDQHLTPVYVDVIQIEQVVLNLVRNAMESISNAECDKREVLIRTETKFKGAIEVEVQDSGPGLPDNQIDHIFEAFFTTKPGGMGMGLSISRSIIEAHGGQLFAKKNAGGGAVFAFTLFTLDKAGSKDEE